MINELAELAGGAVVMALAIKGSGMLYQHHHRADQGVAKNDPYPPRQTPASVGNPSRRIRSTSRLA